MSWRNLFRVKTDFPINHDSGSLKRVLGVRDLTFFGIAAFLVPLVKHVQKEVLPAFI
jgi:hypothetical protein